MIVLISGSRFIDNAVNYVNALVLRIKTLGYSVIVGDAPGIDFLVMQACSENNVECLVHHIAELPRNFVTGCEMEMVSGNYTKRDEYMVGKADIVMCIWNGKSRGTKHVFDYAKSLNIEAYIKTV